MIHRKLFEWRLRSRKIHLGERTLIAAALNVAPDGPEEGRYHDADRALARALDLETHGAALIELTAESEKPGAKPIADAEEIRRLVPVLKRLREKTSVPVAVRTWKNGVAEKVLSLGVDAIHDISGLTWNPDLAKLTVQHDAGLILTHTRGTPDNWGGVQPAVKDVVEHLVTGLGAAAHRANRANVDRGRLMLDVGLGMGKRREHNLEIVARLPSMMALGLPIAVGPSYQHFLAKADEVESEQVYGPVVTAAILAGAHMIRVSDVAAVKQAIQLADALMAVRPAPAAEAAAPSKRGSAKPLTERTKMRPPLRDQDPAQRR